MSVVSLLKMSSLFKFVYFGFLHFSSNIITRRLVSSYIQKVSFLAVNAMLSISKMKCFTWIAVWLFPFSNLKANQIIYFHYPII